MGRIKAISIKQPAASKIADGVKKIEIRTWYTSYRGPILIASSKSPSNKGPAGVALAIVDLVDCRPMIEADEEDACCEFNPQWFSWVLTNIRLVEPFPVLGRLGIYEIDVPGIDLPGQLSLF